MVARRLAAGVLAAVAALALAGTAAAKECKVYEGDFTSVLVPPPECTSATALCTRGTLAGDLPSTYDFSIETFAPAGDPEDPARFDYTGTSVISLDRGNAVLTGADTGSMWIADPTAVPFVTTVNVVEGTRQWKRGSGRVVATGVLDFTTGLASGTYRAELCKERP